MALAAMGAMADATLLLLLFAASHVAEERLYARATGDLTDVSARLPPTALVQRQPLPAPPVVTPLSDVRRGDRIVIKAGEVVRASSLDG
jgi:cation transport ATPase